MKHKSDESNQSASISAYKQSMKRHNIYMYYVGSHVGPYRCCQDVSHLDCEY
jgi:hypothetical protein